jgi:hypothetical protein
MDIDVVEPSGTGTAAIGARVVGPEGVTGTPEATIDQVDRLLDEVEAALTRLDEGTYGTCASCGVAIDDARLAGDPTVRTCGGCDVDGPLHDHGDGALDDVAHVADSAADIATDVYPVDGVAVTPSYGPSTD